MAIHAYVGKPGHGKSYGVVAEVVIPSLKENRHVVTNIPLSIDELISSFGGKVTQLPSNWFELQDIGEVIPPGAVVIFDECWRRWPAGQNSNHANLIDKSLLSEHRHRVDDDNKSMRVVLVTQDLAQISSWVRLLIETTYRIRKLSKKAFKVDIYQGSITGDSPPKSKLIRTTVGKFNPSVFSFYQSATLSSSGVGDESSADGRSSFLRSYGLWACLAGGVLFLFSGIYFVTGFFSPSQNKPDSQSHAGAPVRVVKAIEHPISTTWRLVGFIHPAKPDPNSRALSEPLALIENSSGNSRYISFNHCRYFDDFTEAFCIVDGEKITAWSLKKSLPIIGGLIGGGG